MASIRGEIRQIVDQIDARGGRAETREHAERPEQRRRFERPRREQGNEDEEILDPLVRAHGPQRRQQDGSRLGELGGNSSEPARLFGDAARCIDDDDAVGLLPDGQIRGVVAHIVEALGTEAPDELLRFLLAFQIAHPVGRDDLVEQVEMAGNRLGEFPRRRGRQHDRIAGALLAAKEGDELRVVGQRFRIELGERACPKLELRSARTQQGRQRQKPSPAGHDGEAGLDQQIGIDQGAVEVDANGTATRGALASVVSLLCVGDRHCLRLHEETPFRSRLKYYYITIISRIYLRDEFNYTRGLALQPGPAWSAHCKRHMNVPRCPLWYAFMIVRRSSGPAQSSPKAALAQIEAHDPLRD